MTSSFSTSPLLFLLGLLLIATSFFAVLCGANSNNKHQALIASLFAAEGTKSVNDAAPWRTLADAMRDGEVLKLEKQLGHKDYASVDRIFARRRVLDLSHSNNDETNDVTAAKKKKNVTASQLKQLADDWTALGLAIREGQARRFSMPLQLPPAGYAVAGETITSAKQCLVKALELSSQAQEKSNSNNNNNNKEQKQEDSSSLSATARHGAAWLELGKLFSPRATPTGKLILRASDGGNDAAEKEEVTKVDCFLHALESPGGAKNADTWLQLGIALKEKDLAAKEAAISADPSISYDKKANFTTTVHLNGGPITARTALQKSLEIDHTVGATWFHMGEVLLHFSPTGQSISSPAELIQTAGSEDFDLLQELSASLLGETMNAKRCMMLALRYNSGLGDAWHRMGECVPVETEADRAEHAAEVARRAGEKVRRQERQRQEAAERRQKRLDKKRQLSDSAAAKNSNSNNNNDDDDEMFQEEDEEHFVADEAEFEKKEKQTRDEEEANEERLEDEYAYMDRKRAMRFKANVNGQEHTRLACLAAAIEAVTPSSRLGAAWVELALAMREQKQEHIWISGAKLTAWDALVAASQQRDQQDLVAGGERAEAVAAGMLSFAPAAYRILCEIWRSDGANSLQEFPGAGWATVICENYPPTKS